MRGVHSVQLPKYGVDADATILQKNLMLLVCYFLEYPYVLLLIRAYIC